MKNNIRCYPYTAYAYDGESFYSIEYRGYFSSFKIYPDKLENFNIWKGKYIKDTVNEANNYGLLLELRLKSNMLLAGDCEYSQMPDDVVNRFIQFTHFVIPQHCSKISIPIFIKGAYAKARCLGLSSPKSAIILTGFNTYRTPIQNI